MSGRDGGLGARRQRVPPLQLNIVIGPTEQQQPSPLSTQLSASALNSAHTPDAPAEILPFLYLGGEQHANSLKSLDDTGITAIFNVAAECERKRFEERFDYFSINLSDKLEEDISKFFNTAFDYIDKVKNAGGKVLVHCSAGKSRSPTIVMAYLISRERWTLQQAYEYVKTRRRICPNLGFLLVLAEFEKALLGQKTDPLDLEPRQLRVLLVEDDDSFVEATKRVVTRVGHNCDVVRDGISAIEAVKCERYNVVLMDVHMPGMDGLEATHKIRELERTGLIQPLIIIALLAEDENTVVPLPTSLPSGLDDMLNKPINQDVLEAALTKQLLTKQSIL